MQKELKYGFVIGVLMIGGIYAEYYAGLHGANLSAGTPVLSSLVFLIFGVIWGIRAKKHEEKNGLTYKEAFLGGVTIAFIAGIILGCYAYMYVKAIDPDFVKRTLYYYKQNMDMHYSALTEGEKKMRVESYATMLTPVSQFISAVGTSVIVGALVAGIASFFYKRKD